MREIGLQEVESLAGQELGQSDWIEITQQRVDQFADATGDRQWIHVDVERATREMGGTIAHGFLLLSMIPVLSQSIVRFDAARALNYGCERIRFTGQVRTGDRVRLRSRMLGAEPKGGGVMIRLEARIEVEGQEKPACVAEVLGLYFAN
jgi:acyl dehydratase